MSIVAKVINWISVFIFLPFFWLLSHD